MEAQAKFNSRMTWLSPTLSIYTQLSSLAVTDRRSLDRLEQEAGTPWFDLVFITNFTGWNLVFMDGKKGAGDVATSKIM